MTALSHPGTDSADLKARLRVSVRVKRLRALALVAPLLVFIAVVFLGPIYLLLQRSVAVPEMGAMLPNTAWALAVWRGPDVPTEPAWAALVEDLRNVQAAGEASKFGLILNQEVSGGRSLVISAARAADALQPPFKNALTNLDVRWADPAIWGTLKRLSGGWTTAYFANALDHRIVGYDKIEWQPEDRRVYLTLFARTLKVAGLVTAICLLLAYPVANLLAGLPPRKANLLMVLVLLPFWTSLLVRTTAWIVLLQKQGVINDILVGAGMVSDENRIALIYNQVGTLIAMSHVLLPFMILPIYAVMKTVPPTYMRGPRHWVRRR